MRRVDDDDVGERLVLNPLESWFFRRTFRGKLRLAKLYSQLTGLSVRPFIGSAKLPGGEFQLDTRHRLDWAMVFGGMEQAAVNWVKTHFEVLDSAWDIGAHHGEYSIPLARLLRPGAQLHCFEPFPGSAEVIRRNLDANDLLSRAVIHEEAIGKEDGVAQLFLSSQGSQNHSIRSWVGTGDDSITVPTMTLDTIMARYGVPEFVKMDIEGIELAAFQGATRLLAQERTVFLFESELWNESRSQLHSLLVASGYELRSLVRGKEFKGDAARMIVARPSVMLAPTS